MPELFTTTHHLGVMIGYLATIGWEVYALDLRAVCGDGTAPASGRIGFADLTMLASEALDALGRPAIVMGHGLGGLIALKLAETRPIKAAVALAPLVPGLPNALVSRWSRLGARWFGRPLKPPTGRPLFELLLDVEPFQRPSMVKALVADAAPAADDVVSGRISFAARQNLPPRLVVAGEVDTFAPLDKVKRLADSIGATTIVAKGRGHWLIGGRGLERTIGEAHRFLVRALGEELLLLFPEQWRSEPGDEGSSN